MAEKPRRVCFLLKVKADRLEEYTRRHAAVWPEMLEALRETGWRNYSLFLVTGRRMPDDTAAPEVTTERAPAEGPQSRWQGAGQREPADDSEVSPAGAIASRAESLGIADGLLVGYFETEDLDAALAGMATREVNTKWQAEMAPFFEGLDGQPDEGIVPLDEVFHLD